MINNESKNEITVVFLSNYFVSESDDFVFLKSIKKYLDLVLLQSTIKYFYNVLILLHKVG